MRGNSYKTKLIARCLAGSFLLIISLLGLFNNSLAVRAQTPPVPPAPGSPKPDLTPSLSIPNNEDMISPKLLQPGQPMTYTVEVRASGDGPCSSIVVDVPLRGNQQFTGFDDKGSGFTLVNGDTITDTVKFSKSGMASGSAISFTFYALAPTNLDTAVFEQPINISWKDPDYPHSKQYLMKVGINTPPGTGSTPPGSSVPTVTPTPSTLPTTGPFAPQLDPGQPNGPTRWYIAATKHYLANGFLTFWLQKGAVLNLGWPISEEFNENGLTVQYFERAVFEYHPNNPLGSEVLLRNLGSELNQLEAPVSADNSPGTGSIYYSETGHWLNASLVNFWQKQGGLLQFGYPIAEAKVVNNKLVQWFERVRLELDLSKPNALVEIGLVGREYAIAKGYLK